MEEAINQNIKDFSIESNIFQTIIVFSLAFLIPLFLEKYIQIIFGSQSIIATNSQIIIGSIVNACLIISALNFKGWIKILGVITMPSISTILGGYIFYSTTTKFMFTMIPIIWIGNFILIYIFKYFIIKKNSGYLLSSIIGIILKVLIIYIGFLVNENIVDISEILKNNIQMSMSWIQIFTATLGAIIVYPIYKLETKTRK